MRIDLRPLQPDELLRRRHPVPADLTPAAEVPQREWGELEQIELEDRGERERVRRDDALGARVTADGRTGLTAVDERDENLARSAGSP